MSVMFWGTNLHSAYIYTDSQMLEKKKAGVILVRQKICYLVGWLVVFSVPSTAVSFGDSTLIYCALRRTWSSVFTPFPLGNRTPGCRMAIHYTTTAPRHSMATLLFVNAKVFIKITKPMYLWSLDLTCHKMCLPRWKLSPRFCLLARPGQQLNLPGGRRGTATPPRGQKTYDTMFWKHKTSYFSIHLSYIILDSRKFHVNCHKTNDRLKKIDITSKLRKYINLANPHSWPFFQ